MHLHNQYIKLPDYTSLYTISNTISDAKANIIFLHGYTEHIGRYGWMIEQMNQAGINVFAYDHRGYGKSDGTRAYINRFSQYTEDLGVYLNQLKKPELPTFLMGHSMGSLIGVGYLVNHLEHQFAGFISSSGALKIDESISPFLRKISGIMSKIAPHLKTIKLDPNALSRDPKEVVKYFTDPAVYHGGTKARLGFEMLEAMKSAQNNFHKINIPVLILHGTEDKLADPLGSQWMYDKVSSTDKKLEYFEGLYHEIMNEPEKDDVIKVLITWIKERS
ncbi:MAG: lysophospholipase [Saprospiraceae bacterium]|jgi:acylglycerol lipase|nr:lysophospholipase [Saprospiraceae bacterium]MBP6569756.1 lysophospholipase [Saprospiraceae bacterium]